MQPDRDRVLPWVVAAALFVQLFLLARYRSHTLFGGFDLGYFRQAAWLINHGHEPFITVRGLHLLGDHASPVFYPMAWLTRPFGITGTLLALQSAALAAAVVPLHAIARRVAGLGAGAALAVVIAYAVHPAVQNVNLADFHPEVVALPAVVAAMLFGAERRWVPYGACVVLALLCKEDFALVVAALGLFLVLAGERRAGVVTLVAGAAVFLVDSQLLQRHFAGNFVPSLFLERYGHGAGEIVVTMVRHPNRVATDLFTSANLDFTIAMLAPLLFLPLVAPRYLLPAIPVQLLYLVSDRDAAHTVTAHYTVALTGFLFIALAMALGSRGRLRPDGVVLGLLLTASLALSSAQSVGGLGHRPWEWGQHTPNRARREAVKLIPKDAAVAASDRLWPLLATRRDLYNFPNPFLDYKPHRDPIDAETRRRRCRWLALDTADPVQWTRYRVRSLAKVLQAYGFQKVFERDGIFVYRR